MKLTKQRIKQLSDFCDRVGIKFKSMEMLDQAFHHRSLTNEIQTETSVALRPSLSHTAQNHRYAHHHAVPGYILISHGYHRRLRHSLSGPHHHARRPYARSAARIHSLVCMDEYHKESVLCIHHLECARFLWLHRRGR